MSVAASNWRYPQTLRLRHVVVALAVALLLWVTGQRVEIGRMLSMTADAALASVGAIDRSPVAEGLGAAVARLVPIQVSTREDVSRIPAFDPDHLPFFAHLVVDTRREVHTDPVTLNPVQTEVRTVWLVRPFGYLQHVAAKMVETLEIALWGTIVGVSLGLPLALFGAANMMPLGTVRVVARGTAGVLRAVPEMIGALFLVLAYGFGPIAGVLALGLHAAGFLGKFYADDMENIDRAAQNALLATGAPRLAIWRVAILPQVMPQFIAYTLYVLDRNVRMATVIGLVGAGGIGQEIKGRYDMYQYGHVGTILLAILIVVLLLDLVSVRSRTLLMQ